MPKKCILILLDGIGDRSYKAFDHQTPLQAAKTPTLDSLADGGANGLFHAAAQGMALPSETAHFLMFGYEMSDFPGRGALEALGGGLEINPGDVAVLSHFSCLEISNDCLLLKKGKPTVSEEDISVLIEAIQKYTANGITIRFNPTGNTRGIITIEGEVSPFITDSDPFIDGRLLISVQPWYDYRYDKAAINTARSLEEYLLWAHDQLSFHPINERRHKNNQLPLNGLVTQRAGQLKRVVPFPEQFGMRGLCMASGMVYWGLSSYLGLESEKVTDSDNPGKDLAERITLAHELTH